MAFPILPSLNIAGGLLGAYSNYKAKQDKKRINKETKAKLLKQTDEAFNRKEDNATATYRANKGANQAIVERLLQSQGLLGTSAGLDSIAKSGSDSANNYNDQIGNINESRDRSILNIESQFPEIADEGVGDVSGQLLGAGITGFDEYLNPEKKDDSFMGLFNEYFGKKKKKPALSKDQLIQFLLKEQGDPSYSDDPSLYE